MRFLNPSGLWLLLGIPILIIIYLIKSQHEDRPVSSTYIWKLSARFMKKKLPLQRLRKILLFVLQLLTIITAAMLVARPAIFHGASREYIAILDVSASMQSTDANGVSRLERAAEEIISLADQTNHGHKLTVILAGDSAAYLVQSATSQNEVRQALKQVKTTLGGCNIDDAFTLAEPICARSTDAEVIFYTDNFYYETQNINVVNVNRQEWNVVVDQMTATTKESGTDFCANITSHHQSSTLTVGLKVDGEITSAKILSCPSDVPTEVRFTVEELTSYDTAEIFVEAEDSLLADNYYAICEHPSRTHLVLIVSESPFYLYSGLQALGNCKLAVAPSLAEAPEAIYDLYIFDGIVPEKYPETGSVVQFGTASLPEGLSYGEVSNTEGSLTMVKHSTNATDTLVESIHALSTTTKASAENNQDASENGHSLAHTITETLYKDLDLKETVVSKYTPLKGDSRWETIFTCNGQAVGMTSRRGNGLYFSVMSFDLHDTNLALQTDFALFLQNLLEYSVPPLVADSDYSVGDTVTLHSLPSTQQLYVFYPDGAILSPPPEEGQGSITASETGLYTAVRSASISGEYADFFVHIPPEESVIQQGESLEMNDVFATDVTVPEDAFTELSFWFAALLLLFVLLEWGCYYYEQY